MTLGSLIDETKSKPEDIDLEELTNYYQTKLGLINSNIKENMAYSDKVLIYQNPRNVGTFEDGDHVGTGMVGAPACGDVMKLQIKVSDDGVIQDAKFKTYGCGSAIALPPFD